MQEVLGEIDGGCVIVVKDEKGSVFGAFVNEGLRETRGYYGDGSWSVPSSVHVKYPLLAKTDALFASS